MSNWYWSAYAALYLANRSPLDRNAYEKWPPRGDSTHAYPSGLAVRSMAPSRSMAAPSVGPDRRKLIFIGMRVEVSRHTQKHLLRRLPRTGGTLRAETAGKKTVPARVHARARNLRCHRRCRCGMGEGPGHEVALDGGIEVGPDRRELVQHRHGHLATY